jgi:hypothetical protein
MACAPFPGTADYGQASLPKMRKANPVGAMPIASWAIERSLFIPHPTADRRKALAFSPSDQRRHLLKLITHSAIRL